MGRVMLLFTANSITKVMNGTSLGVKDQVSRASLLLPVCNSRCLNTLIQVEPYVILYADN